MSMRGLLLVDPNPIYREALSEKLRTAFAWPQLRVVEAACAQEALDILNDSDLRWTVLLDIQMSGLSGLASIKAFRALPPVHHVVCLSSLPTSLWEPRAVQAGASLFLSKNCNGLLICQRLAPLLQGHAEQEHRPCTSPVAAQADFRLSARQRDVLSLVAQGHPDHTIAGLLDIKEPTVKVHIHQIYKALRVFNRHQAVHRAQQSNLI